MLTPYRVEFHAKAAAEIVGLPAEAFEALTTVLSAVLRDPWRFSEPDDRDGNPAFRLAVFGRGGMVQFFVDDDARVVRVHGVTWTG